MRKAYQLILETNNISLSACHTSCLTDAPYRNKLNLISCVMKTWKNIQLTLGTNHLLLVTNDAVVWAYCSITVGIELGMLLNGDWNVMLIKTVCKHVHEQSLDFE